jgi:acyl-CoA synthetase (AMP-forming)/AMP-acid ligase II
MALRLLQRLWDHAGTMPHAPALVDVETGDIWNWRELGAATGFVSEELLRGLAPGQTVILCAENEPAYVAAFLGILRAGLQAFCISPASAAAELAAMASISGSVRLLGQNCLEQIRQARNDAPNTTSDRLAKSDQSALLLQSSGSTGIPKIVRRSGASLDAISDALCAAIGFLPSDHVLATAPLCHSYGLEHGLLAPIWAGSCTHLCRRFDVPTVLAEFSRTTSIFPGVPFMFEALARSEAGPTKLRLAYSAGGPLSPAAGRQFASRFGVCAGQVYGTTEIGSVTFTCAPEAGVGKPLRDVAIAINTQSGEVAIRSPWMFDGYLEDSRVHSDRHFRTGDLGHLDTDGNLFITGRLKLVIDVGGRKVNPLEVESVLAGHPEVARCIVVPMPLGGSVTRLKALVIPRTPSAPPALADLRRFVKDRLASYKVPRVFELREQLPHSPTGKILRHLIEG